MGLYLWVGMFLSVPWGQRISFLRNLSQSAIGMELEAGWIGSPTDLALPASPTLGLQVHVAMPSFSCRF